MSLICLVLFSKFFLHGPPFAAVCLLEWCDFKYYCFFSSKQDTVTTERTAGPQELSQVAAWCDSEKNIKLFHVTRFSNLLICGKLREKGQWSFAHIVGQDHVKHKMEIMQQQHAKGFLYRTRSYHYQTWPRNSQGVQRFVGFFLLIVLFRCWLAGQANSDHMIGWNYVHFLLSVQLLVISRFYLFQFSRLSVLWFHLLHSLQLLIFSLATYLLFSYLSSLSHPADLWCSCQWPSVTHRSRPSLWSLVLFLRWR